MYRRYIVVGIVFFLLVGAYFMFFNKKEGSKDYEKYYNKLVKREEFKSYLDDVNINIEQIDGEGSKYSYSVFFDGVNEVKENIKILILDENCNEEKIEYFPSFGIIDNKGYSLVKEGNEDRTNKQLEGVRLSVSNKNKIDYFIIYFSSNNVEQFARVAVSHN